MTRCQSGPGINEAALVEGGLISVAEGTFHVVYLRSGLRWRSVKTGYCCQISFCGITFSITGISLDLFAMKENLKGN